MSRSLLLLAGLTALATLAVSPGARADGPPTPSKHECVEASEAGQDLQQAGKLRDARTKLALCVAQSCPGPVREDCAARLRDIDKAMPSIVFEVKDVNGTDATGVAITIDGQRLAGAGTAIEVDPGKHTFTFAAGGVPTTTEKRLVIVEGVKQRHEVIVLGAAAPSTSPPPEPAISPAPATSPPNAQRPESTTGTAANGGGGTMRLLAFVAGGVGVVGLGVGIGAGLAATSKHSTLQGECMGSICPSTASGDLDAFHSIRTASTVGYVLGALGLAGGGVLFFVSQRRKSSTNTARVRPWIGVGSAGVGGTF